MKLNLKSITLLVLHISGKPFPVYGLEECAKHADFGDIRILTDDDTFKHDFIIVFCISSSA